MAPRRLLVSIVIPVYNGERFVAEAVDSALGQSWVPLEVVVVDDGSTDSTLRVLERYASTIRLVSQSNSGQAAARNSGVVEASGQVIVHLDADDLLPPTSVAVRMAALVENPCLDAVFGHVEQFFDPGMNESARRRISLPAQPLPGISGGGLLVTRAFFDQVGWLNTSLATGADMDWMMRAHEAGMRQHVLPDVVLRRRIHGANMGLSNARARSGRLRILKAALDRRRAADEPPHEC
jgi:glycosyltransferase involved in cell wall biosynthesis